MTDGELDEAERTLAQLEEHVGGPHVQLRALRLQVPAKDAAGARQAFEALVAQAGRPAVRRHQGGRGHDRGRVRGGRGRGGRGGRRHGQPPAPVARLYRRAGGGPRRLVVPRPTADAGQARRGRPRGAVRGRSMPSASPAHRGAAARAAPAVRRRDPGDAPRVGQGGRRAGRASATTRPRPPGRPTGRRASRTSRGCSTRWSPRPPAARPDRRGPSGRGLRLDLPAEDPTTPDFRVWLAFEEALEGRPDRAEQLLDERRRGRPGRRPADPARFHAIARSRFNDRGGPAFAEARERGPKCDSPVRPQSTPTRT